MLRFARRFVPGLVLLSFVGTLAPSRLAAAASPSASAQSGPSGPGASGGGNGSAVLAPDADSAAKAQQHFQRARELYQEGAYREAISELEQAHQLDPAAKDLVYNLASVSEKLGRIDDALRYMRQYTQMNLDATERARADAAIRRLEGAKKEVATGTEPDAAAHPAQPGETPDGTQPPASGAEERVHGRFDALTATTTVLAVAGLAVGTIFGIKALGDRPSSGFTTGRDGTYDALQSSVTHAHNEARIADIGFAVGVVAAAATAILYFARTRPARAASTEPAAASWHPPMTPRRVATAAELR